MLEATVGLAAGSLAVSPWGQPLGGGRRKPAHVVAEASRVFLQDQVSGQFVSQILQTVKSRESFYTGVPDVLQLFHFLTEH